MTTDAATTHVASSDHPPRARSLSALLPGAAALLYAGVQLDGGFAAAAYRTGSTVPDDRLNFPFSGAFATVTSLTWGTSQAIFLAALVALVGHRALDGKRAGRAGALLAVLGGILYVIAHGVSVLFRDALLSDPGGIVAVTLFAIATVLTAAGFVIAGVVIARAGVWSGWRRYPVLAIGIWMLCMLPLQFTALLPLAVAVYAATVIVFGLALLADQE